MAPGERARPRRTLSARSTASQVHGRQLRGDSSGGTVQGRELRGDSSGRQFRGDSSGETVQGDSSGRQFFAASFRLDAAHSFVYRISSRLQNQQSFYYMRRLKGERPIYFLVSESVTAMRSVRRRPLLLSAHSVPGAALHAETASHTTCRAPEQFRGTTWCAGAARVQRTAAGLQALPIAATGAR